MDSIVIPSWLVFSVNEVINQSLMNKSGICSYYNFADYFDYIQLSQFSIDQVDEKMMADDVWNYFN